MTMLIWTAALIALALCAAGIWRHWPSSLGRCGACGNGLLGGGWYEDTDVEGRFCSLVCAHRRSEGLIRWRAVGEEDSLRPAG